MPLAIEEGLAVIPYNPIAGGLLSGKYAAGSAPVAGTRFTLGAAGEMYQQRYWQEREFATVQRLEAVARDAGVSLVTLAIAWTLAHPAITAPLIGASRPDQLDASIAAAEYKLDPALKARLDELTRNTAAATRRVEPTRLPAKITSLISGLFCAARRLFVLVSPGAPIARRRDLDRPRKSAIFRPLKS